MRTALALLPMALLAVSCSASTPASHSATPTGCALVPATSVVGLLGSRTTSTVHGSLSKLRGRHSPLTCRTTVPGHPFRYVTARADYHPAPERLPSRSCAAGWVVAGTPAKFASACQDTVDGNGRTRLLVRWQPYVMHVDIGREDRNWAGDAEVALKMSRTLAQHLEVKEAAGDG